MYINFICHFTPAFISVKADAFFTLSISVTMSGSVKQINVIRRDTALEIIQVLSSDFCRRK